MSRHLFLSGMALFLPCAIFAPAAEPTESETYRWATPVRLAFASCSEFPWVSDLPLTTETIRLLKRSATDAFGLPAERIHSWNNGSAEEFRGWLKEVGGKTEPDAVLILFFATHQLKDGRTRFTKGPDLPPEQLVDAVNTAAQHGQRLVFINDSCYAAALEKAGNFSDRVIRLYAADRREEAVDVHFEEGPFGLEDFARAERLFLQSRWDWKPPGMSLLGLLGLKAALKLAEERPATIDLRMLLDRMNRARQAYDDQVRQAKIQHISLAPADANIVLLKKSSKGD
jgi:hypothetical protein